MARAILPEFLYALLQCTKRCYLKLSHAFKLLPILGIAILHSLLVFIRRVEVLSTPFFEISFVVVVLQ